MCRIFKSGLKGGHETPWQPGELVVSRLSMRCWKEVVRLKDDRVGVPVHAMKWGNVTYEKKDATSSERRRPEKRD